MGYRIKRYKSLYIKGISSKGILYSTGKYSHCFVIILNRVPPIKKTESLKERKRERRSLKKQTQKHTLCHISLPDFSRHGASLIAQLGKNLPAMQETWVRFLGWEDLLEKGRATHSSILPEEFHGLCSPWGRKSDMTE